MPVMMQGKPDDVSGKLSNNYQLLWRMLDAGETVVAWVGEYLWDENRIFAKPEWQKVEAKINDGHFMFGSSGVKQVANIDNLERYYENFGIWFVPSEVTPEGG